MGSRILEAQSSRARVIPIIGVIALTWLFVASCGVHDISGPGTLSTLTISPKSRTLTANGTQQFTAAGADFTGVDVSVTPSWSVVGGGSISTSGLFTAGTTPTAYPDTVVATSAGLSSSAMVIVTVGPLATIVITANVPSPAVGATQQFAAVGSDAYGNDVAITPVWSVANGGGSIDAVTGLFTASTTAGTFINSITATSGAISATASVTVTATVPIPDTATVPVPVPDTATVPVPDTATVPVPDTATVPAPDTATVPPPVVALATITITPGPVTLGIDAIQQFTAVGRDASSNVVTITPFWSVVAGGGSIDAATGLFTAGSVSGTFANTVTATSGTIAGAATITVNAGALAAVTVTPNLVTLQPGAPHQFTAIGTDASGNVTAMTPVWSVTAGGGSIDANTGLFTAGTTAGTFSATVVVTSGTTSGTATVIVTTGILASITVTPNPASSAIGITQQFTAVGKDVGGNVVAITPVWSVVAGGGSIDASTGLFTAATSAGVFPNSIHADAGGMVGTATVTVTSGALASITVTPSPVSVLIGAAQQFTAVGKDAGGNVVAFTSAWSVVAGGGTIDAVTGLFSAETVAGTFANTVVATSGAISGTATVTVTPDRLASITVTPNPTSSITGTTQQFIAVGNDTSGNVVSITPVWSVVAGGGSIDASTGLFTAGTTAGTFTNTVTATSGATSSTVTVIVTAGPLATITVAPTPVSMGIGATQQFTAIGNDANGNVVAITPVWSVVATGGNIDVATGLFTAGSIAGTFTNTVTATSGTTSGAASVSITVGTLASISITPSSASLAIGGTRQFTAVGSDASGNAVAITPVWSVVAGGGSINSTGLFTADPVAGTFTNTVTATSGATSSTVTVIVTAGPLATITVTPSPVSMGIGATQQFTAVGNDANGNVIAITPVWSVVSGGGSINAGTGLFTAGATAGAFANTVTATNGTTSGTATVNVSAGALVSITVTPNPTSLAISTTQQFTAVGRDAGNNVVSITPVWSVVAGGGSINSTGLFTADPVAGTFTNTVMATSGATSSTVTVIVTAGPLATITVTPSPVSLGIGATQQFTAVGKDAGGNTVPITSAWTVTNSGGTIDAVTGLFTTGTISGTFSNTVTATSGTTSGTATVNVSAGPLASITLTPGFATIQISDGQQFTAVGKDANGNVVSITPSWSVVAGGGSIDASTGVFTAGTVAGTFTNTVTATSGGISRTATVNVTAGSLATITIAPNPASLIINSTQQFTAVGRDAGNNIVSITPVWSVIAAGGGIDASTGLFTAGTTAGTFTNTVAATIGTIQGAATVNVVAGALASIDVTPNPASVQAYSTQQFSATGKDAGGNVVAITPVWSVVNGGGSIGAATGLYTAGTISGTFINTVSVADGGISRTVTVTVTPTPPAPIVSLGTAALNGAMAGANVSCLGSGIIDADVSTSTVTPLGGFPPCVITGTQHLNDAVAAQGQSDLAIAYNALVGLACTTVIGTADIGGSTRATGVYCSGSSIGVTGALTLDGAGDPNATFVFQAGSTLTTAGNVILINGAQAKNVYWQVGSSATIGIGSAWQGNIMALTSITLNNNATLTGRALARNGSVVLSNGNVVTLP